MYAILLGKENDAASLLLHWLGAPLPIHNSVGSNNDWVRVLPQTPSTCVCFRSKTEPFSSVFLVFIIVLGGQKTKTGGKYCGRRHLRVKQIAGFIWQSRADSVFVEASQPTDANTPIGGLGDLIVKNVLIREAPKWSSLSVRRNTWITCN